MKFPIAGVRAFRTHIVFAALAACVRATDMSTDARESEALPVDTGPHAETGDTDACQPIPPGPGFRWCDDCVDFATSWCAACNTTPFGWVQGGRCERPDGTQLDVLHLYAPFGSAAVYYDLTGQQVAAFGSGDFIEMTSYCMPDGTTLVAEKGWYGMVLVDCEDICVVQLPCTEPWGYVDTSTNDSDSSWPDTFPEPPARCDDLATFITPTCEGA